ncbi:hypothetical protein JET18_17305 [Chryseobacterium sp. L7]|uniref:Uncharacterized protein n=1 Tax=Chryseobacterium endalhagicum TaxID=2797638 RepID=A0ABS1QJ32_9FLAO|nr:hypothetical protein [Chryseobacterium endalhagicum]MBL1222614.1 hypothetical protein [Chryseobacterium endalhagicum]
MITKKSLLSFVLFLIILYALLLVIGSISAEDGHPEKALNIVNTATAILFSFLWSLGNWGYVLLAAILILLFAAIYWISGKLIKKNN